MESINNFIANIDMVTMATWAWRVVAALLILIFGWIVARIISGVIGNRLEKRGVAPIVAHFVKTILFAILAIGVIIAALGQLGVPTTPFVAVLGAAGLAVGLALQGSLSNFASGVMLVVFRPFSKGDFVEAGGVSGSVAEVDFFTTDLVTPDNRKVIVPNGEITSNPITNYSAFGQRRIDLVIGVSYNDDLKVARDVMTSTTLAHPDVLEEPELSVLMLELGESSVDFGVRPWVKTADYWRVRSELLTQIKTDLEAAGCSIPFPQRDMHVISVQSSDDSDANTAFKPNP